MDLEALRLFAIVAEHGSINGASTAGAGSRTTIRRKLDELETLVGVPLLLRTTHGIELTEAGEVLAARARDICREAEALIETTREVALNPPRPIRVLCLPGLPPEAHIGALRACCGLWPDARLHVDVEKATTRLDPRHVDMYVTLQRRLPEGPFDPYVLIDLELMLLTTPAYLAEHGPFETIADLLDQPLLVWESPEGGMRETLPGYPDRPIDPTYVTNDIHLLHELVQGGCGIALVPHRNLPATEGGTYVRILPRVGEPLQLRLLVSRAAADSPRVKELSKFIETVAREEPPA